ncbi:hypothetical protein L2E82_13140 [Cichorium intybus]|uniref:Uncharacterized protein n=1 Tax=Cichorium intybus TaxID=13427 RepID=A0ACB9GJ53_CICIN|nr:hypothetical protein L2E82_13140 [Cichorium intybus]
MTTIRRFCCDDLLRFSSVNLDHLTETFNMSFYAGLIISTSPKLQETESWDILWVKLKGKVSHGMVMSQQLL